MGIILCALPSCKSLDPTIVTSATSITSATSTASATTLDSVTILRHDSVIYRERTIHDTVYITKEVYRDRLEARGERRKAERKDTVVVTEYRDRVVEHPPEKYVPKFYKWCTIILWFVSFVLVGYKLMRYYLMRR